jgi:hypothetical protein
MYSAEWILAISPGFAAGFFGFLLPLGALSRRCLILLIGSARNDL